MGGVPLRRSEKEMTTIKQLAEHTGLNHERVKEIADENGLNLTGMNIDESRLAIIKALRAGASGTLKREDIEKEHARLLQAKRIKTNEQIKTINAGMGKSNIVFEGYLIDDGKPAEELKARIDAKVKALREMTRGGSDTSKKKRKPDDNVNYYPCSVIHCPRINLSTDEYIEYLKGDVDISKLKTGGINNANSI